MAAFGLGVVGPRGEPPLPKAGSASAIAALVAASAQIERVPSNMVPSLYDVVNDDTSSYYPATRTGCSGVTQCAYGRTSSKKVVVLFGDSHAYMWLPAIVPYARLEGLRLVLIWKASCPATDVTVWNGESGAPNAACNAFRAKSIAQIKQLRPALVLLASRTTEVEGPTGRPISSATWQHGLEHTIDAIRTAATKVAVIGDVTEFSTSLPDCLAAYPTKVQECSTPDPNPQVPDHFAAEKAAAKATHVTYVNPHPWLCTATCSPIVGTYAAYYNNNHVTATYAAFLSGVFTTALRQLLK